MAPRRRVAVFGYAVFGYHACFLVHRGWRPKFTSIAETHSFNCAVSANALERGGRSLTRTRIAHPNFKTIASLEDRLAAEPAGARPC
jgi:hypothetical protein